MGRTKRKFNWRARQSAATKSKETTASNVDVQIEGLEDDKGKDDSSNALVLPSRRKKDDTKGDGDAKRSKKLTSKQRKRLQKVLELKEKKKQRATLLEELQKHQVSAKEMALFMPTTEIGQPERREKRPLDTAEDETGRKIRSVSRANKRRKLQPTQIEPEDQSDSSLSSTSDEVSGEDDDDDELDSRGKPGTDQKADEADNNPEEEAQSAILINKEQDSNNDAGKEDATKEGEAGDKDESKVDQIAGQEVAGDPNTEKEVEDRKPAVYVPVDRLPEIQEGRLALPILAQEQEIMESIRQSPVVIVCGETGSGKTTQVPQFLYEAGYASQGAMIAVTEPRRVAAISMSHRVAMEMNLSTREVSYQIRYEGNTTDDTRIKFMTDGVLLKEIQKDFLLSKYSVVIVDEAHERSVFTDIVIGLLSRIVPLRAKKGKVLKLVIMSATLRVEDFTQNQRLFKTPPPVLKVESRQYSVTVHFNKRTPLEDYITETYKKVLRIHRTLPAGGILVFVTGQNEVNTLCRKLKTATAATKTAPAGQQGTSRVQKEEGSGRREEEEEAKKFKKMKIPKISLDSYSVQPYEEVDAEEEEENDLDDDEEPSEYNLEAALSDDDYEMDKAAAVAVAADEVPLHVLPLYSLLSSEKQSRVFGSAPSDCRLCVVATNVAETSITIPGIKYVVDTGRVKRRYYDKVTGVSSFKVTWTSKASANQRTGRAGRTQPGHCYRLYSSAVFNDELEEFSPPEVTRRPVEDLVLLMKDMLIQRVVNFPFPTAPHTETLKAAEKLLVTLGALEQPITTGKLRDIRKAEFSSGITPLGKAMACFPVSPRYAKMLALGQQQGCLPYVIALVAALTVREIFENYEAANDTSEAKEEARKKRARLVEFKRMWAGKGPSLQLGDLMAMMGAVGASEYVGCTPSFCARHCLRFKAMAEIRRLRRQLTNAANSINADVQLTLDPNLEPPSNVQIKLLREIVLSGLPDRIARKMEDSDPSTKNAYQAIGLEDPVYIHPDSVLFKHLPDYVVYQEIIETKKMYMKGVSVVEPGWLPRLLPQMCTFSKPLDDPCPTYHGQSGTVRCHMTSSFGRNAWQLPAVQLEHPPGPEKLKWLARFMLEGRLAPGLRQHVPRLLSSPSTMVKAWAKLQPRTQTLLQALASRGVDHRDKMAAAWRADKSYLLSAYLEWLPGDLHQEVALAWPPALSQDKSQDKAESRD